MSKFKVGEQATMHLPNTPPTAVRITGDYGAGYRVQQVRGNIVYYVTPGELGPVQDEVLPDKKVYIIGSLRNPEVSSLAQQLRKDFPSIEVFDDWMAAGPEADDYWRDYEKAKGNDLQAALKGHAARHVFEYDKGHLDTSDVVILALPAGKSGHLELGYSIGKGKKSAILLDNQPDRFDVMYGFADLVTDNYGQLKGWLQEVL